MVWLIVLLIIQHKFDDIISIHHHNQETEYRGHLLEHLESSGPNLFLDGSIVGKL